MLIKKTIKAKIIGLTKLKENKIRREYTNFQLWVNNLDFFADELYSATKQQAERLLLKTKPKRKQPLIIRRDLIKIKKNENKLSNFWAKIPIYKKSIWVAIQFPKNQEELLNCSIRESKLIHKKDNWYLLITIQKEVKLKKSYSNILAVDLGEKYIATTVLLDKGIPKFYGKNVRGIRRHYSWLRKRLGNKKLLKVIKRIRNTEQRKVNDQLHKTSRAIVNQAEEENAIIVLGNLFGIRESAKGKGRRFNRIISNMPFYKLSQYIQYKANEKGIAVMYISERGTSHTCSKCGYEGTRRKGLFKCRLCGYTINDDMNGAKNIVKKAKRFMEYSFINGVELAQPKT